MLDSDLLDHAPVAPLEPRDVTDRDDAVGGEERRIGHHPVAKLQPALLEPLRVRHDADAHDDHVGIDARHVIEHDRARQSAVVAGPRMN